MTTPKYRTDSQACSCPGYWYRKTCRHYRAYGEAVALVLAQDVFNKAWAPIDAYYAPMGEPYQCHHRSQVETYGGDCVNSP